MKKNLSLMVLFLLVMPGMAGQDQSVLITVADKEITLGEFEWMYGKNLSGVSSETQTKQAYLQSYVDLKLKVREAEELGLDTASGLINELEEYRQQLFDSYIPHQMTEDELVNEAYERMSQDVNASHILIKVTPDSSPEDTLEAFNKISGIRQRILNGEDFETVARATSEDPSVELNGGDLNFFTVFSMLYPFENVAYTAPLHTVTTPFRTKRGYHIMMVHKRRKAYGQIRIAHIFVSAPEQMSPKEQKVAKDKITAAYNDLYKGISFADVAAKYSEDTMTAAQGGELSWFGVGQNVPEFEDIAFAIDEPYDISVPFQTIYGWHIVELLDKSTYGTLKEMAPYIRNRVQADRRAKYHQDQHVIRVKTEYGFTEFPAALVGVYSSADSSLLRGEWDGAGVQTDDTPLLKIGARTVTVGDFIGYITKTQDARRRAREVRYYINELYAQFKDEAVLEYEKAMLPVTHPEINYISNEYYDGLLLFDIMDRRVWSKALNDTAGLHTFFENHRTDYMWNERTEAVIVTCSKETNIRKVRSKYKKIQSGQFGAETLNEKYCDNDTATCIHVSYVLTEKGIYDKVDARGDRIGPGPVYSNANSNGFVILVGGLPPGPKKLSEVRGQVISDYQKYLESQWVAELRNKYPVTINKRLFSDK